MSLVTLAIGVAIGAIFHEVINRTWRKITTGRAYGPVPAAKVDDSRKTPAN